MSAIRPASNTESVSLVRFKIKGINSNNRYFTTYSFIKNPDITISNPPKIPKTFDFIKVYRALRLQCSIGDVEPYTEWAKHNQGLIQWKSVHFEL
jgi:hypothetical protein